MWSEAQKITASDRDVNNRFGQSVAIEGDFAIVGAYYEDPSNSNNSINNAGVAYLYERSSAGTWAQIQKLSASDAAVNDRFGYNVEIEDGLAIDLGTSATFSEDGTQGYGVNLSVSFSQ